VATSMSDWTRSLRRFAIPPHFAALFCIMQSHLSSFYVGIVDSKARVSATMRSVNPGSRACLEPSIGWPPSS
jgi:hypothetical protein